MRLVRVGRMRRVPEGAFSTPQDNRDNVALARQIFGIPATTNVFFDETHVLWITLFAQNVLDVLIEDGEVR